MASKKKKISQTTDVRTVYAKFHQYYTNEFIFMQRNNNQFTNPTKLIASLLNINALKET